MKRCVSFNLTTEAIEVIDRLVIERRRRDPSVLFTRADFFKEATLRALQEETQPRVRERVRASVAA